MTDEVFIKRKTLTDIYVGVRKNSEERQVNDLYPTPPLGTYALIHTLGDRVPEHILEPCAGRGHIAAELSRHGRQVVATDLYGYERLVYPVESGHDATISRVFSDPYEESTAVVTNPPYFNDLPRRLAEKWVVEYEFVAMFVRLTFLEGKRRKKLFTEYPPSDIVLLSDRINFGPTNTMVEEPIEMKDQIGGMIAYAWVVWDKAAKYQQNHWVLLEELYPTWRLHYESSRNELPR